MMTKNKTNEKVMHKRFGRLWLLTASFWFVLLSTFFLILIFVLTLSTITAGCCFDNGIGTCSDSSDELSCTGFNGEYFGGSCASVDVCQEGCCALGSNTEYSNEGRCEILSRDFGFEESFIGGISREDCSAAAQTSERGACVSGNIKPYDCEFTTREQCPADFYVGLSCTTAELNTICTTTDNTMCYNEQLYSKDSCNNPGAILENCDFNSGKVCRTTSSNSAYCKSLDCDNGAKNGESWCVDTWGNTPFGIVDATPTRKTDQHYTSEFSGWVGSRYFTQYCLNGAVITEPCADFRMDTCSTGDDGQATCEVNPVSQCLMANGATSSSSSSGSSSSTGADEGNCDSDYCNFIPGFTGGFTRAYNPETGQNIPDGEISDIPDENKCASIDTKGRLEDLAKQNAMCLPKIPGGLQFYPSRSENTLGDEGGAEEQCALGNFEATAVMVEKGLTQDRFCTTKDYEEQGATPGGCVYFDECLWVQQKIVKANPALNGWLTERCRGLGDCDGSYNWVKISGANAAEEGPDAIKPEFIKSNCKMETDGKIPYITCYYGYKLSYTCEPWKAPGGDGDCALCGTDGLECSEYRCMAAGSECEYKVIDGVGNCISNNDKSSPIINLNNIVPPSPVPPYTAVQISISTNKLAECKFNLGSAENDFNSMEYDFGRKYTAEHTTTLYLPGQKPAAEENNTQYSLITDDGNYDMYVRCMGVNGKYNLAAQLIQFEVMQTPDTTILGPKNFAPVSGSRIVYNTTQKAISLTMDEPAECKWNNEDKTFSEMKNNFSCDNALSDYGVINGYSCSGTITNVTLDLNSQSKYYIRCKDQPQLGNDSVIINGVTYSRNTMDESYEYVLKPSEKLEIAEVSPSGQLFVSGNNISIEIEAITSGGSTDGTAKCYWKHSNETINFGVGYYNFGKTNSFEHKQTITAPTIGNNFIQVKCEDSAGNVDYKNSTFNVQIDISPPSLIRLYSSESADKLIIKTIEDAICYFSFDKNSKCSFSYLNATIMSGVEKEHTADWEYDTTYYIKCKDYRGNENTGNCAAMIRTY
ncbi:MAG: hypothetical protein AABX17_02395 [Nanoarchaeota archaeon]